MVSCHVRIFLPQRSAVMMFDETLQLKASSASLECDRCAAVHCIKACPPDMSLPPDSMRVALQLLFCRLNLLAWLHSECQRLRLRVILAKKVACRSHQQQTAAKDLRDGNSKLGCTLRDTAIIQGQHKKSLGRRSQL